MSIQSELEAAWPEFVELAGVSVTIAGQPVQAVQIADEGEALNQPFDASTTLRESQLAFRLAAVPDLRRETPLQWAGARWRVADIRGHSASPIVLATVVREA